MASVCGVRSQRELPFATASVSKKSKSWINSGKTGWYSASPSAVCLWKAERCRNCGLSNRVPSFQGTRVEASDSAACLRGLRSGRVFGGEFEPKVTAEMAQRVLAVSHLPSSIASLQFIVSCCCPSKQPLHPASTPRDAFRCSAPQDAFAVTASSAPPPRLAADNFPSHLISG